MPHALPVHPHQLEVQEFDSYALIVDLRAAEAHAVDHIPRAVSMSVDAPNAGTELTATLQAGDAVLVYCDQGGLASNTAAQRFTALGVEVDVLPGGWVSYRRWVTTGVEILARSLQWRWIRSMPGGVSQALVQALHERGEQVFEIGKVFDDERVPGRVIDPACKAGPALDSRIVDRLRRVDPGAPVWVGDVRSGTGEPLLPAAMHEALQNATTWHVDATLDVRARILHTTLRKAGLSDVECLAMLERRIPSKHAAAIARVRDIRDSHGNVEGAALMLRLLDSVLDPIYDEATARWPSEAARRLEITAATPATIDDLAAQLIGDQIKP